MYPTLIVVIVASRRSVLERSQASAALTEVTPPRRFRVNRESVGTCPRFPARSSCSMTVIGGNDDEKFDVSLGKNRSARSPLAEEVQAIV